MPVYDDDSSDIVDQLAADSTNEQTDVYDCVQCGGPVNFIRNELYDHIEVEYYRCQDELGCRQGGERVYDLAGDLIRTVGPVFEEI